MTTWVLILTIMASYGPSSVSIPNFATAAGCEKAGKQWHDSVSGMFVAPRTHVCIEHQQPKGEEK